MPDVPQHYQSRGIAHWSPTKLNTPFWLVLAEYAYRLPKFFEARRDQRAIDEHGNPFDPEAGLRVQHYSKRGSIRMDAGSAVGEAAVRVINGEQTESEAVADTIARLQTYEPDGAADAALTANLLAEDASAVSKTLENTVIGLREIYQRANQVEAEERVEIELPGVDVPSLGFSDVRGGGVITEIKTQWDKASNTKSGFSNNSVPTAPRDAHVLQIGHYHRRFGGTAKILYANRVNYRIFEIPTSHLNAAMDAAAKEARRRQRMLERTETVQAIMELCEPDWSHWMLRSNYSPELIGELQQVFYGD